MENKPSYLSTAHPLINAIQTRNERQFQVYSKNLKHVNSYDEHGNTPLHVAIMLGYISFAKDLLLNGADMNMRNAQEKSPLDLTIETKRVELLLLMSEQPNFNIEQQDKNGNTPLLASILNRLDVTENLLKKGANAQVKNNEGLTPLLAAIMLNSSKDMDILYKNGYWIDKTKSDSLFYAVEKNNIALFQQLLRLGVPTHGYKNGKSLLALIHTKKPFLNCLNATQQKTSFKVQIEQVARFLRKNYAKKIYLTDELAKIARMHPSTLCKYFKQFYKKSPSVYQKDIRLTEAIRLIKEDGYGAAKAAEAVGYEYTSMLYYDLRQRGINIKSLQASQTEDKKGKTRPSPAQNNKSHEL